jgi:hypothetical protein
MIQPGRRAALAALLVGVTTVISGHATTAGTVRVARKKRKRKPDPTCPAPATCPPLPDTCPDRSCCECTSGPTPGCRFGGPARDGTELLAICDEACGGGTVATRLLSEPAIGLTTGCTFDGECTSLRCPLT